MKIITLTFIILAFFIPLKSQQSIVIDHRHTNIHSIPDEWITEAKSKLKIRYYRRSHGSQVDGGGMTALKNYTPFGTKYNFSGSVEAGSLFLSPRFLCIDYDTTIMYAEARAYLDNPSNASINVVMFAWSYNTYKTNIQAFLDTAQNFIRDYGPNGLYIQSGKRTVPVTFVFQTACSLGDDLRNKKVFDINNQIRQYCINKKWILFDFNDIEGYNPDGVYFGDGNGGPTGSYLGTKRLNDDISYLVNGKRTGNWGIEWRNANPGTELYQLSLDSICASCPHSDVDDPVRGGMNSRLHCVLKGQAAWWLFAVLAGWQEGTSGIDNPNVADAFKLKNYPNPFSGETTIEYILVSQARVKLEIWDKQGKLIRVLADEDQEAGTYKLPVSLNVSDGIYFYTLQVNGQRSTKKMISL